MPNLTRRDFTAMSSLVTAVAVAGCRNSDGTPVSSGFVFLYAPGTTTLVPGYKDDALSQVWTTVGGGIPLDAGGRANIWVSGKVDVIVTNASGQTVTSMLGFNGVTANTVEVENAGYTGAITDPVTGAVSQGAGGQTDLDTVLSNLASSFGGADGKYQESKGATARRWQDIIRSIFVTPQDFGALGNGVNDDTTACQAALNEIKRLGGGIVYFGPGTYKISSPLSLNNATGVLLLGAGQGTTDIHQSTGSTDAIDMIGCTDCGIRNLATFGDIVWSGTTARPTMSLVTTDGGTGVKMTSASNVLIEACTLIALNGNRGLLLTNCLGVEIIGGSLVPDNLVGTGLEIAGTTGQVYAIGVSFSGCTTGIAFDNTSNGHAFAFISCPSLSTCTTPIDLSAISADPVIYQAGNLIDSFLYSAAVGNTLAIKLQNGYAPVLKAASGGAGTMTVSAPTPTPLASAGPVPFLEVQFVNGAGGAVTWSMNAAFVLAGGVAIPTTDGHTINVVFRWDYLTSKWREVSRSDTVT